MSAVEKKEYNKLKLKLYAPFKNTSQNSENPRQACSSFNIYYSLKGNPAPFKLNTE